MDIILNIRINLHYYSNIESRIHLPTCTLLNHAERRTMNSQIHRFMKTTAGIYSSHMFNRSWEECWQWPTIANPLFYSKRFICCCFDIKLNSAKCILLTATSDNVFNELWPASIEIRVRRPAWTHNIEQNTVLERNI